MTDSDLPTAEVRRGVGAGFAKSRRITIALVAAVGTFAAGFVLFAIAHHVAAGNSDGATVVLEGKAVTAGHVLLGGWSLSLDSFWTVDVPFYAIAVALFGVSGTLMTAVPAAIAALVVLISVAIARDGRRGVAGAAGFVTTAAVLLLPGRAMALFYLQGPFHVATLLWCLIAFVAIDAKRFGGRWVIGVAFLALGLLGDLQTLLLGVIPLFAAALILGHLRRDLREVKAMLLAPLAAGIVAVVVREITKAIGTFAVPRANSFASLHQLLRNLAHLPGLFLSLIGVENGPFGPSGIPLGLRMLHITVLLVVLGGPVCVAIELLRALRQSHGRPAELPDSLSLDTVLLCTFAMGIATFVVLPIISSDAYARYLLPAVVTGAILGGRVVARKATVSSLRRPAIAGALLVLATVASSFGFELQGSSAPQPAAALAAFLRAHGLRQGIGDYWDASVISVASKGQVLVRPVIADDGHHLVRYDKQSTASWYGSGQRFNFLIFNAGAVWNGVGAGTAVATLGRPVHVYPYGTYRVYVWATPFSLSVEGSTGP